MTTFNITDNMGTSDNMTGAQAVAFIVPLMSTTEVDQTVSATFGLTSADVHNNGAVVQMTDKLLDSGWTRTANVVTYTGTPNFVEGIVTINAPDVGVSNYWARPKLRIIRGGDVIAVLDDLVMQQNGAYDGDFTLNAQFFDKTPGVNPTYTFEWFDKENRTATLAPETFSQIAMKAVNKVNVLDSL